MTEPETLTFGAGPDVPNHNWPLMLYRGVLSGGAGEAIRQLESNGWGGAWTNGVYPFTHYHSNAHEVLAVVAGTARLRFGGEQGEEVRVEAGDVAVLPAGTGHQRVDASADFSVVGAYPTGQHDWDLHRPDQEDAPVSRDRVREVPRPAADPVYGPDGPLLALWPAA
ncbi:cupin domain-containing protein [Rubrivirga marina]|uniref:Cupin type-2 domain-containing protein n=1 Tax=Rubrivirga marina TaxID=1196024 RepID=A0A271IXX7_9BACT|nr:cupin domain-containing protein [Rubrivirga marina]PAP76111.1 hypothetical protein BSZ37_06455 [Rubrivirga marina]